MAEIIYANVEKDIADIGKSINEKTVINPRYGNPFDSLPLAIQKVMEAGGFEPFLTEVELLASIPTISPKAAKALDTKKIWYWGGGSWIDTGLSELDQALDYAKNEIKTKVTDLIVKASNNNAVIIHDDDGNLLLKISNDRHIYSPLLEDSIQNLLQKIAIKLDDQSKMAHEKVGENGVVLVDSKDNLFCKFDNHAQFFINGIEESVQSILSKVIDIDQFFIEDIVKSASLTERKFCYEDEYSQRFNNTLMTMNRYCPIPHFSYKQKFSIGSGWVDQIKLEVQKGERIKIAGFHPHFAEDIGVVHPQIWSFNQTVAGYKYWLGINPYTNGNEDIELPYIYGSNDPELKNWELIPNFPQPFEKDPVTDDGSIRGHLSDSGFAYDVKTGDLVFFWRKNLYYDFATTGKSARYALLASKFDGKKWSEVYTLMNLTEENHGSYSENLPSPNIVYNATDDLYYMFYLSNKDGKIYRRTSRTLDKDQWSERELCISNSVDKFWHMDMKFVGNKLVALIHCDDLMAVETIDKYLFAVSDDFLNFTCSQSTIITNIEPHVYKATFLPEFVSDNEFKMKVVHTSDSNTSPQYQLYVSDTNIVNFGE